VRSRARRPIAPPDGREGIPSVEADRRVALRAAEEWSVLSLAELLHCGLSQDAVEVRARNGRLHRMYRSVYAIGHPNLPLEGRFLAGLKACGPGAVLSHFSAAAHWEMVEWDDRRPEVTVVADGVRAHVGLRVHRTSILDRSDVARHRGIPVTSPARTLLDLASILEERALRRAVRRAQSLRLVHLRQLVDAIDRLGRYRRGVRKLARVVATGPAPTRSELEDVVLDLLLRGGFEHPAVNRPLILNGRRVVPDFRWPEQRLVVEADGGAWHDHKLAREDDAERQALLEAHGERVIRVTWHQAITQPSQTLARVRAAGAPTAHRASS
jgi:very-short-patch-repair endonuclease